jgi:DNA-binding transcriptional LysR family regulator
VNLHHLKLFHEVASHLSLSKAAEELHISQPAVSIQIKKLEDQIGLKLLERKGRQIDITQSGKILYGYTTNIFKLVQQAREHIYSLNGTIWGSVQVGATNTPGIYIMPRILGEFKKRYPDTITNLHVSNGLEIEGMLYNNQLDFAVMSGGPSRKEMFRVQKIYTDMAVLVVSPDHPLANREEILMDELRGEVYITQARDSVLFRLVETILAEMELPFKISMSLGNTAATMQAVSHNLGISFMPLIAVELYLKLGLLKRVTIKDKAWEYGYYLVCREGKSFSPAVEKLFELCKEEANAIQHKARHER